MASTAVIPNIALGRLNELIARVDGNDPTNAALVVVFFETGDSVANLRDFDSLSAVLAGASAESAFTNYARTVLDDTDITSYTTDDTGDAQTWELADQQPIISSAGGASNEAIDMVGIFYDPDSTGGTDADLVPLLFTLDDGAAALVTTNGSDLDLTSPTPTWSYAQA